MFRMSIGKQKMFGKGISIFLCLLLFLMLFGQGATAANLGDVNGDGSINVKDVILVQKHILLIQNLTAAQKILADVNGDGNVTIEDAVLIMKRATGIISSFPLPPSVTSPAFPTVAGNNRVTITLAGGTFKTGTITAADFTFSGSNAAALAAGTFSRISDMVVTVAVPTALVADTSNTVSVKTSAMAIQASSVAAVASTIEPVTSPIFNTDATDNNVTITLTGGTFRAGALTAADFTFTGANAAALAVGIYTRVSDTVVAITVPATLAGELNNTVTVKGSAMAIQATSVAAVGNTIANRNSNWFPTAAGNNTVTVTLTGGVFIAGPISAVNFNFTGPNAVLLAVSSFTRVSDTVVTITTSTPLAATVGDDNRVRVNANAMAVQATSVAAVASTRTAVTSPAYNTASTHNKITITLTGGTFKAGPIVAADFEFAGANAAALAAGTFSRVSDTVVTVTVAAPLAAATNNTVTVKAVTMATQASLVTVVPSN